MNYDDIRKLKDKGPYDMSLEYRIDLYDKLPYVRDINLCNRETICLNSGNIIKYYRYKFIKTKEVLETTP